MHLSKEKLFLYGGCALFLLVNLITIWKELFLFPLFSVFALIIYLLIYRVDILLYLLAFITPLSITLRNQQVTLELSLPSEIIMVLISVLFLFRVLYDLSLDKKLAMHPISIAIYIYFIWLVISTFTSEMPIVSVKYIISRLWFVIPCYFMVIHLVKNNYKKIVPFFTWHAIGVAIVVIYTTFQHSLRGFSEASGHWVMYPFYNDHTAYGAILAFMLPIVVAFFFLPENKKWQKVLYLTLFVILLVGFYFSFSRAAWVSLIGAIGVLVILKLRIKLSWVVVGVALLGTVFYFFADDIFYKMSRNTQDSSGDLKEHIQSISNISTDASNVERLNRWVAAQGMIQERPITGWGAGTYQFVYAPFQKGKYKTIISTNFGDGGNAHSEYIGPWAETGTIGLLTVLALVILVLYYGIKTYISSNKYEIRLISLALTMALITYFLHGLLNNFLDTDKLALPYWACFASIVILNTWGKTTSSKEGDTAG